MRLEGAMLLWDASEAAKAVRTFAEGVAREQFFADLLSRSAITPTGWPRSAARGRGRPARA